MICEVLHTTLEVELFDLINFVSNDYWLGIWYQWETAL